MPKTGYRESSIVLAARIIAALEPILAEAPPSNLRDKIKSIAETIAESYGLPRLNDHAHDPLQAAQDELMQRLADVGAQPFDPMDDAQARVFLRGLPFDMDSILLSSDAAIREFMPKADGRPKVFLATSFHACGIVKGGLAALWRR